MFRFALCSLAGAALFLMPLSAAEKKSGDQADHGKSAVKAKKLMDAKVIKVEPKKGTITLRLKDPQGKEIQKTFTLADNVRIVDETGQVVTIDAFHAGNDVLIVEEHGKLRELHKQKSKPHSDQPADKKTGAS